MPKRAAFWGATVGWLVLALAAAAEEGAPSGPGAASESEAERLERRDEVLSARLEYQTAFSEVAAAAAAGNDARLWGRAEFLLEKICILADEAGEPSETRDFFAGLESLALPPALKARATWLRARLFLDEGKADEAARQADALGVIRNWLLWGVFDSEQARGLDEALTKGELPAWDQPRQGKKRPVKWRAVQSVAPLGEADCGAWLRPNSDCAAYAACFVDCPAGGWYAVRLGADEGVNVWVNGRSILETSGRRRLELDQNAAAVWFRPGRNLLLLRTIQTTGPWRFILRLTDPAGAPASGLTLSLDPAAATLAANAEPNGPEPQLDRGAFSIFVAPGAAKPADPREEYYLGWLLWRRGVIALPERQDRELLLRAVQASPKNGAFLLALAEAENEAARSLPDREENLRRQVLERLRENGPDEVLATARLAEYYLRMGNLDRALALAEEAAAANPLSPRAALLRYEVSRRRGWRAQADTILSEAAKRSHGNLELLLALGRRELESGQTGRAVEAFLAARRLTATGRAALDGLLDSYARLGRKAASRELLTAYLRVAPYDFPARRRLIGVWRDGGQWVEGADACREALGISAEDAGILALWGDCLHGAGREEEAAAAWRQARELESGQLALEEYLRFLGQGRGDGVEALADLAGFAAKLPPEADTGGAGYEYLLNSRRVEVHPDGTSRRVAHQVIRLREREAVASFQRYPIYFSDDLETVSVPVARVLHADGTLARAEVTSLPSRDGAVMVAVFPALRAGDVLELAYVYDQFRPSFFGSYFGEINRFRREAPVRRARYEVVAPAELKLYFLSQRGAPAEREAKVDDGRRLSRVWEMQDLAALPDEADSPSSLELSPAVQVSTFASWDELARWYWRLIEPQLVLTPEIRDKVRELVEGRTQPADQIAALYEWVSTNIRNVPWEFGVHRYKPYSAGAVFTRRFGDCKDHAVLLNVMAQAAGLSARPVLLMAYPPEESARRGAEALELPLFGQFNHCISLVEAGGRPYWLDATKIYRTVESNPAMTAGARVVVVGPEGARLDLIPPLVPDGNFWRERLRLSVDEAGGVTLGQELETAGRPAAFLRLYYARPETRLRAAEVVGSRAYGPGAVVSPVDFQEHGAGPDSVEVGFSYRAREFVRSAGGRLEMPLPPVYLRGDMARGEALPARLGDFVPHARRESDLLLPLCFRIERHFTIDWPAGWRLVNQPGDLELSDENGQLRVKTGLVGNSLTLDYWLELSRSRVPVTEYAAFRRLCLLADQVDATVLTWERE